MIVIAIIGILSAVAVPQYGTYLTRAKFSEITSKVGSYKAEVTVCIAENNTTTGCNDGDEGISSGISTPIGFIHSLTVSDGSITATGTQSVQNAVYKLDPSYDSVTHTVTWSVDTTVANSCISLSVCKN